MEARPSGSTPRPRSMDVLTVLGTGAGATGITLPAVEAGTADRSRRVSSMMPYFLKFNVKGHNKQAP